MTMTMMVMMMRMMKVLMNMSSEKVEQLQKRGSKRELRSNSRRSSSVVEVKTNKEI